ncbi:DUF4229 domain-containing protein [Dietzia timorensis]|uniref:DUF4229 domain-containing protein n=1 Tax=Dietzia timorensis TaxID=499555 RepID=A0A173LNS9_9ACTN|nr:DUF4229 domain-containing protein [Dietzia timorensis]ANI93314.1 Hypothetical protein BJL86_2554 [Dietzia timorensis]
MSESTAAGKNPGEKNSGNGASGAGASASPAAAEGSPKKRLAGNLLLFTLARIAIVLVLVAIIEGIGYLVLGQPVPLLVAGLIAIILALPISTFALRGWSRRINEDIAAVDSGRRTRKEDLRRRMSE